MTISQYDRKNFLRAAVATLRSRIEDMAAEHQRRRRRLDARHGVERDNLSARTSAEAARANARLLRWEQELADLEAPAPTHSPLTADTGFML